MYVYTFLCMPTFHKRFLAYICLLFKPDKHNYFYSTNHNTKNYNEEENGLIYANILFIYLMLHIQYIFRDLILYEEIQKEFLGIYIYIIYAFIYSS